MEREYTGLQRRCPRAIGGMHAWPDRSAASMNTALILEMVLQVSSSATIDHQATLTPLGPLFTALLILLCTVFESM